MIDSLIKPMALLVGCGLPWMAGAAGLSPDEMAARAASLGLPQGTVQLSPCVPAMGEHWARLADMPFGPIYGADGDRVTFVEVMIAQSEFESGASWNDVLRPPAGHAIDHVDIHFEAAGHEGYEIPHYDIHAYFMSHAEQSAIC